MEGRQLVQYLIDTSDVVLEKKQEATEYLAKLEAAQQGVHWTLLESGVKISTCPTCGNNAVHVSPAPQSQ